MKIPYRRTSVFLALVGGLLILSAASLPGARAEEANPGQQVVNYFRGVFEHDWPLGETYDPATAGAMDAPSWNTYGSSYEPFPKQDVTTNANVTPVLSPETSESLTLSLINNATTSLFIEQMYFYETLTDVVTAVTNAASRGVNCSVIVWRGSSPTSSWTDHSRVTADTLEAAGVDVRTMDGTVPQYFNMQHNKGIIVDGTKVLVASINWSPTSLRENREAGLLIESAEVGAYYTRLFYHDWDVSDEYTQGMGAPVPASPVAATSAEGNAVTPQSPRASAYQNHFSAVTYSGTMDVTCMASPDNCFDVVAGILQGATRSIDVSVYTFSNAYLMAILHAKLAEGVQVRLLLEKNQVSSYERRDNRYVLMNLTQWGVSNATSPGQNLTATGKWANPDFDFQHCKYCIVDNQTLILSSGNWAQTSCPKPQADGDVDGNRDWWIAIYGNGFGDPTDPGTGTGTGTGTTGGGTTIPDEIVDLLGDIPGMGLAWLAVACLGAIVAIWRRQARHGTSPRARAR